MKKKVTDTFFNEQFDALVLDSSSTPSEVHFSHCCCPETAVIFSQLENGTMMETSKKYFSDKVIFDQVCNICESVWKGVALTKKSSIMHENEKYSFETAIKEVT